MTRRNFEGDPLEALRRADPLDPLEVPTDTTGVHARALFQEVTSMERNEMEAVPRRQPLLRRLGLAAAGVAVVAAAAAGGYVLLQDEAEEVIVGGQPIDGGAMASCIIFDEATLVAQEYAFDGTLVEADGIRATFEVHSWYKGGTGDRITLNAEGLLQPEGMALLGLGLEVGDRYLVSGAEGFVHACGYSVTYDTQLANHWAEIFG